MKEFLIGATFGLTFSILINTMQIKDRLDRIEEQQVKCNKIFEVK